MADIPPPPPPPTSAPPPAYQPPPGYQPGSPGYMPQPIAPSSAGGLNLGVQIAGAGWSIGIGVIGILLPFVTGALFGGTAFYFRVMPIFGVIYGVRAIMRGYVIGGAIGIGVNILAGLVSLTFAGLINPGT